MPQHSQLADANTTIVFLLLGAGVETILDALNTSLEQFPVASERSEVTVDQRHPKEA
jgi:type III secretory pathway component EscT